MSLVVDFLRALGQMTDPRFRRVLWRALLIVLAAFVALLWGTLFLIDRLAPETATLPWIGEVGFLDGLASVAAAGVVLALSVVLMAPATAAAAGFFLDDVAAAVEAKHYPRLPPATPPPFWRQARDGLGFLGLILVANFGAFLVLVFAPPLAPFAFLLVNGFLLGREYFQLVALRRLDAAAAERLRRLNSRRIWLAGVAMALPLSLPIVNLFVPIFGVAVFTHQFHRFRLASSAAA